MMMNLQYYPRPRPMTVPENLSGDTVSKRVSSLPIIGMQVSGNGLVDIESGAFLGLSPRLWIHHGVDYEHDPEAKCPVWDRFLDEVFPDDQASQDCIEEQLGLGMTNDVRFQKGFLWIGLKGREGKSTLAFMQEQLCGSAAYVSLAFPTWLRGE